MSSTAKLAQRLAVLDAEDITAINQMAACAMREAFKNYQTLLETHPEAVIMDVPVNWRWHRYHLQGKNSFMIIADKDMQLISLQHLAMN